MFCLRVWLACLFFLTNASPIYLLLFLSASYILNRPCVYCSILLAILVLSIFDFHHSWFEPTYSHPTTIFSGPASNTTSSSSFNPHSVANNLGDVAALVTAVVSSTAREVVDGVKQRVVGDASVRGLGVEWVKGVLRKEWRVQCLDLAVRL